MSWFIVCIGVSTPPQKHPPPPPYFLPRPPSNWQTVQALLFKQSSPVKSSPPFLEIWLEAQPPGERRGAHYVVVMLKDILLALLGFRFTCTFYISWYYIYKTFQMCYYHQHACLLVCLSLLSACLSVKFPRMIQVTRKKQGNSWIPELWVWC